MLVWGYLCLCLVFVGIFSLGFNFFLPSSTQVNALIKCKAYGSRKKRRGEKEGFMNVILT